MGSFENHRREARVDARIQVFVVRGRQAIPVETTDISFRGLFLKMPDPPALRSLMRLRVALPLREIEVHAMAVHVAEHDVDGRPAGVGVQFWGLAGPDAALWNTYVRELIETKRAAVKRPKVAGDTPHNAAAPVRR